MAKRHNIAPDEIYSSVFRREVHAEIDNTALRRMMVFFSAVVGLVILVAVFGH